MGITVSGDLIVKGDQIFDGGMKIVHNHGGGEEVHEPLTTERLKKKIDLIRDRIENGRLWFPVCKYMMWEGLVAEGDFTKAGEVIKSLYPDVEINTRDVASMNVMSFRKALDEWNADDSPVKGQYFYKYKNIATALYEL